MKKLIHLAIFLNILATLMCCKDAECENNNNTDTEECNCENLECSSCDDDTECENNNTDTEECDCECLEFSTCDDTQESTTEEQSNCAGSCQNAQESTTEEQSNCAGSCQNAQESTTEEQSNCAGSCQNGKTTTGTSDVTTTCSTDITDSSSSATTTSDIITTAGISTTESNTCPEDSYQQFKLNAYTFGLKFLYHLIQEKKKENPKTPAVMCSPLAELYAISSLTCFSYGHTYKYLLANIYKQKNCDLLTCDIQVLNKGLAKVTETFNTNGSYVFLLFTKSLQFTKPVQFTSRYKSFVKNVVVGKTEEIDDTDPVKAKNSVNSIVKRDTNIPNIITSTNLDADFPTLLLCTAFSIKLKFKYGFGDGGTDPFYTSKKISTLTKYCTQTQVMEYTYSKALRAKIVKLPMQNENLSMMICLPDENSSPERVIKLMQHPKTLNSVLTSFQLTTVTLSLPCIKNINTSIDSQKIIKKIAPSIPIYNNRTAEFADIITVDRRIDVSQHVQEVSVVIDYTGNSTTTNTDEESPEVKFICSRPFFDIVLLQNVPLFFRCTLDAPLWN